MDQRRQGRTSISVYAGRCLLKDNSFYTLLSAWYVILHACTCTCIVYCLGVNRVTLKIRKKIQFLSESAQTCYTA